MLSAIVAGAVASLLIVAEAACKMRFARALRLLRVELAREGLRP